MKAIITGVTGFRNRGVEAMVRVTVEQLLSRHPELIIDVLTKDPIYDRFRLNQENVNLKGLSSRNLINRLLAKGSRFYKPLSLEYPMFRDASVVIASGGDVFSSDYGIGFLKAQLEPLSLALAARTPAVFLAQSIGPFKTQEETDIWLDVAQNSQLITVREKLSYEYLIKNLNLPQDLVKHTADPAFLLTPPAPEHIDKLLNYYGIVKDFPIVAISPSQGITTYTVSNYKKHLKAWHQAITMILEKFKAQILVIPHVHDGRYNNDDPIFATNLLKSIDFDPRVRLVSGDLSASEYKGLISACDMVIAERMHVCIAGLSSGVCTFPIGYSVKAEGIMTDLFGTYSQELLISFQQFLETDLACERMQASWERRHQISEQLNQVLPEVKKKAENNFQLISQILTQA
jgi:colanic acid/amylovoran biosynthesis protein